MQHDPDDAELTYKLRLAAGDNWFRGDAVEELASPAPAARQDGAPPASGSASSSSSGPGGEITLDTLQGRWLTGNGTEVAVDGRVVRMNGLLL